MGRAAVRARMMGRACQGLGRRGYAHRSSTTDLERESKSAFLPKENCNRQQTTTRTPAPALIRNASAKRSRPGRGRPGVAPAGSVYGAVISGRFCVDQDLNIDLGPKSSSGPGFDIDHRVAGHRDIPAALPSIMTLDCQHGRPGVEVLPPGPSVDCTSGGAMTEAPAGKTTATPAAAPAMGPTCQISRVFLPKVVYTLDIKKG